MPIRSKPIPIQAIQLPKTQANGDISLTQLNAFLSVAACGSVSLAAQQLGISQPTLSRQLAMLETRLGKTLFDRQARPLALTAVGEFFLTHATQSIHELNELIYQTRHFDDEDDTLIIGFVASVLYGKLPSVISQLKARRSGVNVRLVEVSSHEQADALKMGVIHAGFGRFACDDRFVMQTFLCDEPYVVAVPKGHPFAGSQALELGELTKEVLILYHRSLLNLADGLSLDPLLVLFLQGSQPITHKVRDLQIALGLVAAGEGITLVPKSLDSLRNEAITYVPIAKTAQQATTSVYLSTLSHKDDPRLSTLIDVAKAVYAKP